MLFKDFMEPRLTKDRVSAVIDRALEDMEYDGLFDPEVAVDAVHCYLGHSYCPDEFLDAFQEQLDAGLGPDDREDAYECIQSLSESAAKFMHRDDAAEYLKGVDVSAVAQLINRVLPDLLHARDKSLSEEDFALQWTQMLGGFMVAGMSYVDDEFMNYVDGVGCTKDNIIKILEADRAS